jgi:hypothetical protein
MRTATPGNLSKLLPEAVRYQGRTPPEWRGYQVILVNGRYIVVRPQTYEIVYIIEG